MSFDDRLLHTLVVKRLAPVTSGGAETVGGADTTLTADTAAGALTITVADSTEVADGDFLRVGDTGEAEIRIVAPGGVAGLVVTLTAQLDVAHDAGDQVREVDDAGAATLDEYGQAVEAATTFATVPGLIQPRRAREVALATQDGVVLGEHAGYIRPLAGMTTHDWIEKDGVRFDILSIADAGGIGHHWELGLRQVS